MQNDMQYDRCKLERGKYSLRFMMTCAVVLMASMFGLHPDTLADDLDDSTDQRPLVYTVENTGASLPNWQEAAAS